MSTQYAHPLSWEARTRTSSRSAGSIPARSSSRVAAPSRWDIARENAGAALSKSRRTGISVIVVMRPPCAPGGPRVRSSSMSDSWATSGVDLHLDLAGARGRVALERALREAVRSGRLRPGVRLPPSRALAADLRIARNTVAETYGQLVAEGWLVARQGSGTLVAERVAAPEPAPPSPDPPARARYS